MLNKTAVFSIAVAGVITTAVTLQASAQQLSPSAQQLANSVNARELEAACAKGKDGMTALVRDKIMTLAPQERRMVQAEGPNIGNVLGAKCPK
jgi:hypothetical protein